MKIFIIGLYLRSKMNTLKYAIFIALSLLCEYSALAQSFIDTSKIWSIVSIDAGGGPYQGAKTTIHFKFVGDTVINTEKYYILYNSSDISLQNWKVHSFWNEKNDSIFRYNSYYEEQKLIYDFSIAEKDSFQINESLTLFADSVRFKEWGGKMRKHWYFHKLNGNPTDITVWIEGAGNINNFTQSSDIDIAGAITRLLCFTENGELVYQNPEYNSCSVNTSVHTIKNEPKLIEVYNSCENKILVNLLISNPGIFQVYDLTGNKIVQKEIELIESKINLPSKGTFIYRFITQNGEVQTGKVLVK